MLVKSAAAVPSATQSSRPNAHHKDCLVLLHLLCFAEVMSGQPLGQRLACTPNWVVSSQWASQGRKTSKCFTMADQHAKAV